MVRRYATLVTAPLCGLHACLTFMRTILAALYVFTVQTAVLPLLLPPSTKPPALYEPFHPPRDVCVSAPTGSGKTLSYVVPIVEVSLPRSSCDAERPGV